MKKNLAVFIVAMLGACDRSPRAITLPEVNEENCRTEAVLEWVEENNLSKEQMWEFTGKCARGERIPEVNEENCKPENIKNELWGAECRIKGFGEPARSWGSYMGLEKEGKR